MSRRTRCTASRRARASRSSTSTSSAGASSPAIDPTLGRATPSLGHGCSTSSLRASVCAPGGRASVGSQHVAGRRARHRVRPGRSRARRRRRPRASSPRRAHHGDHRESGSRRAGRDGRPRRLARPRRPAPGPRTGPLPRGRPRGTRLLARRLLLPPRRGARRRGARGRAPAGAPSRAAHRRDVPRLVRGGRRRRHRRARARRVAAGAARGVRDARTGALDRAQPRPAAVRARRDRRRRCPRSARGRGARRAAGSARGRARVAVAPRVRAAALAAPARPPAVRAARARGAVRTGMNLALAHEYFSVRGGAERVVEVFHDMWPSAPVHTFFHDKRRYGALPGWDLRTSYLQQLPIGGGLHRALLPLYPNAAAKLRIAPGTDLVLTSTSAFIKCIEPPERTVHVAYCHSPTRYLWDQSDRYLEDEVPAPLHGVVGELLARLREIDLRAARRVDRWIANSSVVRDRIARYYGAESEIVHPPVDVARYGPAERGDFWLFVGRLVGYKRADVAVDVFDRIGMRLIVVGEGRERGRLERRAKDNVTFAGRVDDETVRSLLGAARGLIFPGEDDFGIVCVEALASGTPVVALGSGGATDI